MMIDPDQFAPQRQSPHVSHQFRVWTRWTCFRFAARPRGCGHPEGGRSGKWRGVITQPHFPIKAKRIIHLCMAGGPSQFESLDFKPELQKLHKQPFPESFTKGQQLAQLQNIETRSDGAVCGVQKAWQHRARKSPISSRTSAAVADDLCIVRSMFTEQINHDPAHTFMNTGAIVTGRPSFGSWMLYGLGAETEESARLHRADEHQQRHRRRAADLGAAMERGHFAEQIPGHSCFKSKGDAVHYIGNPEGVCQSVQRQVVEEVNRLNGYLAEERVDPEIQTRIAQYELAFRMQTTVPELTDFSKEPKAMLARCMASSNRATDRSRRTACSRDDSPSAACALSSFITARGIIIGTSRRTCRWPRAIAIRPTAALIKDLKQRGMLEDTLILWGGEFGRTPMAQGGDGRDHHILGFSVFMAGGGVKPGTTYGATDELGYRAVENTVSVHDLHATMLHLCGIDHKRLSMKFQGLDVRLTNIAGSVVKGLIA